MRHKVGYGVVIPVWREIKRFIRHFAVGDLEVISRMIEIRQRGLAVYDIGGNVVHSMPPVLLRIAYCVFVLAKYAIRNTQYAHSTPTLLLSPSNILYALGLMGERLISTLRPMRLSSRRPGMSITWLFS